MIVSLPSFEKIHPVRHSAADMFDLVADVEQYPEFVPLCQSLSVRSRREKGDKAMLVADMTVAYKMLRETFTSQVMLRRNDLAIDVQYLDGPFKYLENKWYFADTGEGCDVHFSIDYEFKSRTLGMVMGSMFDIAFRKFTKAFEQRADEVYGKNHRSR